MRYTLEKKIRLQAGTDQIFLGLSEEDYTKTVTVNLQEGYASLEEAFLMPKNSGRLCYNGS